ncbi:MAG: thiamine pyrophosphate-dependent enzyme [Clostridia bacterium]|nr:thiamine pyrophosphate-dependent enzyme [Clostridia bacterium]
MIVTVTDYLRQDKLPHLWCGGCSHGVVVGALARALAGLGIPVDKTVITTGIGCFGKADDYFATHALHGTHGRALAFASGVKAVSDDLTVLALMGDGDAATIGGNHLIHAARRNMDITAIVSNNSNYGMTGGQYSATTPSGKKTSTSCYGNPETDFDLCALIVGAGGGFVARTTPFHVRAMEKLIAEAISYRGFSFVEVVSCCPTYYGRYNREGDAAAMVASIKERAMSKEKFDLLPLEEQPGYFPIGKLHLEEKIDFNTRYREVKQKAQDSYRES